MWPADSRVDFDWRLAEVDCINLSLSYLSVKNFHCRCKKSRSGVGPVVVKGKASKKESSALPNAGSREHSMHPLDQPSCLDEIYKLASACCMTCSRGARTKNRKSHCQRSCARLSVDRSGVCIVCAGNGCGASSKLPLWSSTIALVVSVRQFALANFAILI